MTNIPSRGGHPATASVDLDAVKVPDGPAPGAPLVCQRCWALVHPSPELQALHAAWHTGLGDR